MFDFLQNKGGKTRVNVAGLDDNEAQASVVWNTEKVNKLLQDHENGIIDIKTLKNSPFKDNDPSWKKPNIVWQYTPEEYEELEKCKADIIYFAEKYCQIMTENGVMTVKLHDYQEEIVNHFKDNRFNILMASRQVGKTWMSSVFIVWYTIFHIDKNTLVVADNAATTKEVIDKIKTIFENMPFFLKPGCITNAVMTLKFDNGCRVIGRSTTKKTGIGFNIHLLYIDEFAHINEAYIDNFFRSIYPTISASKTSKVIITSTPNGMNKFHDMYQAAMENKGGKDDFVPLRVDWWQFPGRDEEWKAQTIINIGSEEDFNQEYGLQFFASDKLLLNSKDLKKIFKLKTVYVPHNLKLEPEKSLLLDHLTFHPNFAKNTLEDLRYDPNYYVFSIDTADGLGKDYLVCNIYKFVPLPVKMLESVKHLLSDRMDIFGLIQVGVYRTNKVDINEFCRAVDLLTFEVFNHNKVKLNIELNHKGDYVHEKMKLNELYSVSMMVHSKHTMGAQFFKPGISLTSGEIKNKICERAKYMITCNKIIPNEFKTCMELGAFGKSRAGTYRSQSGNDDLAITTVNCSAFFESPNFWELANEVYDLLPPEYLKEVKEKIFPTIDASEGRRGMLDMGTMKKLNEPNQLKSLSDLSIFSAEGISIRNSIIDQFNRW